MAICSKCSTVLPDDARFCSACGQPVMNDPQQNYYAQQQPGQQPNNGYQNYQQRPSRPMTPEADAAENKGICVLCYLGILLLIPLLTQPNSPYVRFHSNQGLVLLLLSIAIGVIGSIPYIGWFLFAPVGYIFTFICVIIGIVNTANGQMKQLPLIGKITLINYL